jgi:16S rRNA (cytidine1402-2'-O)-methyltransferase
VTAAVALCGFAARGFVFEGFLPVKSGARRKRLEALLQQESPAVLFESPFRIVRLLEDLAALAPERPVFVGRELTKKFEECLRGTPRELLVRWQGRAPKGEFVVVLGPAREGLPDDVQEAGLVDRDDPGGYSE